MSGKSQEMGQNLKEIQRKDPTSNKKSINKHFNKELYLKEKKSEKSSIRIAFLGQFL